MVSSLLINLSKSATSSAESLVPDVRLDSDELRTGTEYPSSCDRPMRPFNLLETWDVVEPAVTGRLFSRELPELNEGDFPGRLSMR